MKPSRRSLLRAMSTCTALALALVVRSAAAQGALPMPRSASEAQALVEKSGLTPAEIQDKLRAAGVETPGASALESAPKNTRTAPKPLAEEPPVKPDSLVPNPGAAKSDANEPFGFEIFHYTPQTFEPLSYGPVDPDYPLGPGDELALTLWGDDQLSTTLRVDREGYVTLPDVGQVSVNGLPLEEAQARVRASLAKVYSGLRGNGTHSTTFLHLSLGRLRSIQVFLLGRVVRPGSYTVSSVSRVLNALYAAGGPLRDGSLRDVRILRGGKRIASVDLYTVILGGDASGMPRLENGDVVFVPPASRRIALNGAVRRPGLFELREGDELRALLDVAGGVLPQADVDHAQIDRVIPVAMRDSLRGQSRMSVDVSLASVLDPKGADVALLDGDSLMVQALPDRQGRFVTITGRGILRPGRYEFRTGMRISDLLTAAGGTTPQAYLEHALVTRTLPDSTRSMLRFSPSRALANDPGDDLELKALDAVSIQSLWDLQERQVVSVHGDVHVPGEYELLEGMTLSDLLLRAGGFTDQAYAVRAEVARVADGGRRADTLDVPLTRDLAHATAALDFMLRPNDAVFIRRDPDFTEQMLVVIEGEVRFPGTYALTRRDERVADLVRRAGGLTDQAYPRGAQFLRQGGAQLAIHLHDALRDAHDRDNLVMLPGDTLRVPRYTPTVKVEGAVFTPVTALYQPGAGVGYYVTQASGYRNDADRGGIVVISPSGAVKRGGQPEPGSRIVVPARPVLEARDHLKDFATLMSILASAATTAFLLHQSTK